MEGPHRGEAALCHGLLFVLHFTLHWHVCRAWRAHIIEVKQERARQEADQQQLAEQHHRQVLVRGLWEGLGKALALRRTAHQDAHRHFQLCHQRLVSDSSEQTAGQQ